MKGPSSCRSMLIVPPTNAENFEFYLCSFFTRIYRYKCVTLPLRLRGNVYSKLTINTSEATAVSTWWSMANVFSDEQLLYPSARTCKPWNWDRHRVNINDPFLVSHGFFHDSFHAWSFILLQMHEDFKIKLVYTSFVYSLFFSYIQR